MTSGSSSRRGEEEVGDQGGDRSRVKVERGAPVRLASVADRSLGGPRRVDAVELVEKSLEREAGLRRHPFISV